MIDSWSFFKSKNKIIGEDKNREIVITEKEKNINDKNREIKKNKTPAIIDLLAPSNVDDVLIPNFSSVSISRIFIKR